MRPSLSARVWHFLVPEPSLEDPVARAQARRLNAFLLLSMASTVIVLGLHAVHGRWSSAAIGLVLLVITLAVRQWGLRQRSARRIELAGLGMLGVFLLLATGRALLNGQSRALINWSFAIVPIFAAYMLGVRWAIRVAAAAIGCLLLIHLSDAYLPLGTPPLQTRGALLFAQLTALVIVTALAVAQRRISDRQIEELEAQHRTIREQAAELARARDAALAAARLQSQFLANVSHELRTPLHGVIGMTQVLQTTLLTAEQRDFVGTIRASGEGLLALVNDLLDLSKLEAGQMALEQRLFALRPWLTQTLDIIAPQARDRGLVLALDIAPDVPERVVTDPHRLRQVLLNLLGNALKFTERGEVAIRVRMDEAAAAVGAATEPVRLHFSVSDTGIGIPEDSLGQLFQPFRQADASISRRYGGTGLGLAISKHLCELMGGTIRVESVSGQGTTFHFSLRVEDAARLAEVPGVDAALPHPGAPTVPLRILLADDNSINRKVGREMLKRLGYEADVASHGLEVLAALGRAPYDVVLMDAQMPELDGLTTTRRIRAELPPERQPYIIAMTASAMPSDRERCAEAGMDDFLGKPVSFETLAAALERAVRLRTSGKAAPAPAAPAAEQPPPQAPIMDAAAVDGLLRLYEEQPQELADLVREHLLQSERLLETLRASFESRDDEAAARAAHSWRGNSSMFGAKRLSQLCGQMETLIRDGKLDAASTLLGALEELFRVTATLLRERIAAGTASALAGGDAAGDGAPKQV